MCAQVKAGATFRQIGGLLRAKPDKAGFDGQQDQRQRDAEEECVTRVSCQTSGTLVAARSAMASTLSAQGTSA